MGKNIAKDFERMWKVANDKAIDAVLSAADDEDMKDHKLIDARIADQREHYLKMMFDMYTPGSGSFGAL
jgi:hypothetical protein